MAIKNARVKNTGKVATHWHRTKGDADYMKMNTLGTMGNRWKHFGIREDNQTLNTRGRARYLKREGQLVFKNKTGKDETRHGSKQNVSRVHDTFAHPKYSIIL